MASRPDRTESMTVLESRTCGLTVVNVSGTFLFRDYYQAHMAMFNQAINENTTIGGLTTAKRNRARQWPPTCTGQPPD